MPDSTPRLSLINHGGFFSPHYQFDVLTRQHGDELDVIGAWVVFPERFK